MSRYGDTQSGLFAVAFICLFAFDTVVPSSAVRSAEQTHGDCGVQKAGRVGEAAGVGVCRQHCLTRT